MVNRYELNKLDMGMEFVVSFFSGSCSLALKSSLKSHQMTPFSIQNEDWEQNDVVLVKTLSFGTKKVVIWWLFDDDLRARERRPEEKETTNSAPLSAIGNTYKTWSTSKNALM